MSILLNEIEEYFTEIAVDLKPIEKVCETVQEFMDIKSSIEQITFILEDLEWKPNLINDNSYRDIDIYFQVWHPVTDITDASEIRESKIQLRTICDQITAKVLSDYNDPGSEYHPILKHLDLNSMDFVTITEKGDRSKIGIRGQYFLKTETEFNIDSELWN